MGDTKGNNTISFDASRNTKPLSDYYEGGSEDPDKEVTISDLEKLAGDEEAIFNYVPQEAPRILSENPIVEKKEWAPSNPIEERFKCPIQYVVALKSEVAEWKARGWC